MVEYKSDLSFDIPILMILFNRPKLAERVFENIKNVKPKKLFFAVDGPRYDKSDDKDSVLQCQQLSNLVDWPCEVKTLFREKNLGCKVAVSTAISWFFNQVEFGIILEDDCLPNKDFFYFCEELLHRYKDNSSIMYIGGTNFQDGNVRGDSSYFFSKLSFMWGWATWRRAWKLYDVELKTYPNFEKNNVIRNIFDKVKYQTYWKRILVETYRNKIDTWDYQWLYCVWINNGLCALPNINLISNIGYGLEATHTYEYNSYEANRSLMAFTTGELRHPLCIVEDKDATTYLLKNLFFSQTTYKEKIKIFVNIFMDSSFFFKKEIFKIG